MRKPIALLAVASTAAAIATPAFGAGATVRVNDNFFRAKTVRITKGSTVTWRWAGQNQHNVVFRGFKSHLQTSGSYRHKFGTKGTFRYVCTIHEDEGMKGTVIVR